MTKKELIARITAIGKDKKKTSIDNLEELLLLAKEADYILQKPKAKETIELQQKLDQVHEQLAILRLQNQVNALKAERN